MNRYGLSIESDENKGFWILDHGKRTNWFLRKRDAQARIDENTARWDREAARVALAEGRM